MQSKLRKAKLVVLMLVVLVAALGAAAVSAQFDDGRVNAYDPDAPVAVYCTFTQPDLTDLDYSVFSGIEVLWINPETNNGSLLMDVSADAIDAVGATPEVDTVLASAGGFTLYRAATGEFYITGPADAEGKPYSFVWERGDLGC